MSMDETTWKHKNIINDCQVSQKETHNSKHDADKPNEDVSINKLDELKQRIESIKNKRKGFTRLPNLEDIHSVQQENLDETLDNNDEIPDDDDVIEGAQNKKNIDPDEKNTDPVEKNTEPVEKNVGPVEKIVIYIMNFLSKSVSWINVNIFNGDVGPHLSLIFSYIIAILIYYNLVFSNYKNIILNNDDENDTSDDDDDKFVTELGDLFVPAENCNNDKPKDFFYSLIHNICRLPLLKYFFTPAKLGFITHAYVMNKARFKSTSKLALGALFLFALTNVYILGTLGGSFFSIDNSGSNDMLNIMNSFYSNTPEIYFWIVTGLVAAQMSIDIFKGSPTILSVIPWFIALLILIPAIMFVGSTARILAGMSIILSVPSIILRLFKPLGLLGPADYLNIDSNLWKTIKYQLKLSECKDEGFISKLLSSLWHNKFLIGWIGILSYIIREMKLKKQLVSASVTFIILMVVFIPMTAINNYRGIEHTFGKYWHTIFGYTADNEEKPFIDSARFQSF